MATVLVHRGDDDTRSWFAGPIGLGHRMLWTTPESRFELIPLVGPAEQYVITADARIDNRDELISTLRIPIVQGASIGDNRLILAAYERWGERCPEHLIGDFAFALWDARNHKLFCARDHLGVKPFYYHFAPGQVFVFATEIKAFWTLGEVPHRLNEMRIGDYLTSNVEAKASTFFQAVLRLPPAHSLVVDEQGLRLQAYWELDPNHELQLGSAEAYAEAFHALFTEAVRCRLRAPQPLGSLLSGGLDSSSIAGMARQQLSMTGAPPLHTFSAVFDTLHECDERPFIDAVLAQGKYEPHEVVADHIGPLTDWQAVLEHCDEPHLAPNVFLNWALYEAAQRQGVRVLLDGFMGDITVFNGTTYLAELARSWRWITFFQLARSVVQQHQLPVAPILRRYVLQAWPLRPLRARWRALRPNSQRPSLIQPDFARSIGVDVGSHDAWSDAVAPTVTERMTHFRYLNMGINGHVLEVLNHTAARFAIEPRFPFCDKRLVEFCLAVPGSQKLRGGWTRSVLRHALSDVLPAKVQWRAGKGNLSASFTKGLQHVNHDIMDQVVVGDLQWLATYVDIGALRDAYYNFQTHDTAVGPELWKVVMLALWQRRSI